MSLDILGISLHNYFLFYSLVLTVISSFLTQLYLIVFIAHMLLEEDKKDICEANNYLEKFVLL